MSAYYCDYDAGRPPDWMAPPADAVSARCSAAGLPLATAARLLGIDAERMGADGALSFAEWATIDRICERAARDGAALPGVSVGAPVRPTAAEVREKTRALLDANPGARERIRAAQDAGWRGNFDALGRPLTDRLRLHQDARRLRSALSAASWWDDRHSTTIALSAIRDRLSAPLPGDLFDVEAAALDGVTEAQAVSNARRVAIARGTNAQVEAVRAVEGGR